MGDVEKNAPKTVIMRKIIMHAIALNLLNIYTILPYANSSNICLANTKRVGGDGGCNQIFLHFI